MTYIKASEEVIDAATEFVQAHSDYFNRVRRGTAVTSPDPSFTRLCEAVLSGPVRARRVEEVPVDGVAVAPGVGVVVLPPASSPDGIAEAVEAGFSKWKELRLDSGQRYCYPSYEMGFDAGRSYRREAEIPEPKTAHDTVNHPSHYNTGSIEVILAIEDWGLGFCDGNAVKYIARSGKKDPTKTLEDLKKAQWYLERLISNLNP